MDRYYRLLKEKFPTKSAVMTELINLEAIQHLPKGTEYFVSDLHGEFEAFDYLLRSGAGLIKHKIKDCFAAEQDDKRVLEELALYILYPKEKMERDVSQFGESGLETRLLAILPLMLEFTRFLGEKYSRSKVRKAMPKEFAYIIEELLTESENRAAKQKYVTAILAKVAQLDQLEELVGALSLLIQRLNVDHLHVVGDIYDRGKDPDRILDTLLQHQSVDIQWGNHDITWMGAISGSLVCLVNVIRIAARYNNLELLEERYGINLRPLIAYSQKYFSYQQAFEPVLDGEVLSQAESVVLNQLQQATALLQFKLEEQLIKRRPEFKLNHRRLLSQVDFVTNTICLNGVEYPLDGLTTETIDQKEPTQLSLEEVALLQQLNHSFQQSEKLRRHVDFLFEKGSMYLVYNQNLLFHGCLPLHENGDFKSLRIDGIAYAGKDLLDFYEASIRRAYKNPEIQDDRETDLFWYLWVGESSSLFGKKAMTTFERYYISDKTTHFEEKNAYYRLRNQKDICQLILEEFGLTVDGRIINGHTPVREKIGESPIKADGQMLVIDGGFAKGYQAKTGLAGYTLVSNSYGLQLVAHRPFTGVDTVLAGGGEIISAQRLVDEVHHRILVKSTTIGSKLAKEIQELDYLYQNFEEF
ncbi:fructose-1,6-bisphosphatase [Streptococcus suis]